MSDTFDPRPPPNETPTWSGPSGDLRPAVAGGPSSTGWFIGGGVALAGLAVFLWLSANRTTAPEGPRGEVSVAAGAAADPAPPPELLAMQAAARGATHFPAEAPASEPVKTFEPAPPPPIVPMVVPQPQIAAQVAGPELVRRGQTPVLVVDMGYSATPGSGGAKPAAQADAGRAGENADEQFAARIEGAQPERSRAMMLRDTGSIVAQGTMIPAVLETALNSDLPGFSRAVVSRDVRSFDGRTILVPRGSRLIGQYRSAQALGASRAFVIWTRILRPDGASIQIGSSGADELGRAGLAGKVDRHFFERFGGSILLSVINAGLTAAAGPPSAQVVIGSSQDANSVAASATLPQSVSPTITVAQGTPIRIFVARDLDFSTVADVAE